MSQIAVFCCFSKTLPVFQLELMAGKLTGSAVTGSEAIRTAYIKANAIMQHDVRGNSDSTLRFVGQGTPHLCLCVHFPTY